MGKYMKKGTAKITENVSSLFEIPQSSTNNNNNNNSSSLGVLTRARTLALQPNPELSYLQLRSRRLEKPPFINTHKVVVNSNNNNNKGRVDSVGGSEGRFGHFHGNDVLNDFGSLDGSFGENNLDFDTRPRSTRESTPCSLIRDPETIGTPGSTTRPTCSTSSNRRARNIQRTIPTNPEMEEFFAGFEHNQQKFFVEKYNYDITNDLPLPGRYEWVKVD